MHDQVFKLFVDTGSSHGLSLRGAIEFLRHQFAMPGEDGGGFDDGGDFLQGLLPQLLANLREGLPFAIAESNAPLDLVTQNPIFRDQIFVAQQ